MPATKSLSRGTWARTLLPMIRSARRPSEASQCRHADLLGRSGHRIRRIDAEHGYAPVDEVLQQVAVVAGEFHHETVRAEPEPPDRHVGVAPRVRQPLVGVGREIDVVAEQLFRRHVVIDLHQFARFAHLGAKRVSLLVAGIRHRGEERIGRRLQAEIRHGHGQPAAACAAGGYQAGHLIDIGASPSKASMVRRLSPTMRSDVVCRARCPSAARSPDAPRRRAGRRPPTTPSAPSPKRSVPHR